MVYLSHLTFFCNGMCLRRLGWGGGVHLNLFESSDWVLVNEAFTAAMGRTAPAISATQIKSHWLCYALREINKWHDEFFPIIESLSTNATSFLNNQLYVICPRRPRQVFFPLLSATLLLR